jgi:hypothetical protein
LVATETDGTWGKAQAVAGITAPGAEIDSVSCASPGNCAAVGFYSAGTGLVVNEVNGVWGAAQPIGDGSVPAGAVSLQAVSCAAAGDCTAVGVDDLPNSGPQLAVVVTEANGTWGSLAVPPGISATGIAQLTTVSCAAPGTCVAGGFESQGPYLPMVADEVNGAWANVQAVPGSSSISLVSTGTVTSVSCPAVGECAAAGYIVADYQYEPFVANETGGAWGSLTIFTQNLTEPFGENAELRAVSCGAPGNCAAVGWMDRQDTASSAFAANEVNGTWGVAQLLPGAQGYGYSYADAVSCPAANYCTAGGMTFVNTASPSEPMVDSEATPSQLEISGPTAGKLTYGQENGEKFTAQVSSPDGGTPTGTVAITAGTRTACVITLSAGTGSCQLSATALPAGTYPLTAAYSGDATYLSATQPVPTPVTVVKATAKTTLTLAKASAQYGYETAERLSVVVIPQYAGTPYGSVEIKAGKTVVCTIALKAGKGSCTLTARQLKAGTYTLTGSYTGSSNFLASTAPAVGLKITL